MISFCWYLTTSTSMKHAENSWLLNFLFPSSLCFAVSSFMMCGGAQSSIENARSIKAEKWIININEIWFWWKMKFFNSFKKVRIAWSWIYVQTVKHFPHCLWDFYDSEAFAEVNQIYNPWIDQKFVFAKLS